MSEEQYYEAKDRERAEALKYGCHHAHDCNAAIDDTEQCEVCEAYFCADHLYNGACAACFELEAAAEAAAEIMFAEAA